MIVTYIDNKSQQIDLLGFHGKNYYVYMLLMLLYHNAILLSYCVCWILLSDVSSINYNGTACARALVHSLP